MPTGYTAKIYEGKEKVSLSDFVLICSRAFGFLVNMREESLDAKIPLKIEPSLYYQQKLDHAKKEFIDIEGMTLEEVEKIAEQEFQKEKKRIEESRKRNKELELRYSSMLSKVKLWIPVSKKMIPIKNFMIQQLKESIKNDTGYFPTMPEQQSGEEYKKSKITKVKQDIKYYEKNWQEELERTAVRNEYLTAMWDEIKRTA